MTRRGAVYEYIRAHPGAHVRGIANDLQLATGDLQYHLHWLEKHGLVKTRRSGFYRFVYPTMVFQERHEVLLGVLTQETPREILLSLLHDPGMTQGGLARSLGHSQPTISWHLERMMQTGLVSKNKTVGGTVYKVAVDRDEIVSFVRTYHQDVWKRWAGRFATAVVGEERKSVAKGGSIGRAGLMPTAIVKPIGNG
jgi:predicted transcriptional regulator